MKNSSGLEYKIEKIDSFSSHRSLILEDLPEIFWLNLRSLEVTCAKTMRGRGLRARPPIDCFLFWGRMRLRLSKSAHVQMSVRLAHSIIDPGHTLEFIGDKV